jgi:hypothetical protein
MLWMSLQMRWMLNVLGWRSMLLRRITMMRYSHLRLLMLLRMRMLLRVLMPVLGLCLLVLLLLVLLMLVLVLVLLMLMLLQCLVELLLLRVGRRRRTRSVLTDHIKIGSLRGRALRKRALNGDTLRCLSW